MRLTLSLLLICWLSVTTLAQSTSMTFQGRLDVAGVPANGTFDLRFTLFNALAGGSAVSAAACAEDAVITNGLCTVILPFTLPASGLDSFIEIQVRANAALPCSDTSGYTTLSPRQRMTPAPAAVFASAVPEASPSIPGAIRFNPTTRKFEGYDGLYWAPFAMDTAAAPPNNQVFATPGSFPFTVPPGVTRLGVDIHAGGGGGGARGLGNTNPTECNVGATGFSLGGGGGASGSSGRFVIDVTPGEVLTIFVGSGGAAGTISGGASGTASRVRRAGNTIEVITAPAGAGGSRAGGTGAMAAGVSFCNNADGAAGAPDTSNPVLLGSGTIVQNLAGNNGSPGNGPSCFDRPSPQTDDFCAVTGGAGGVHITLGQTGNSPFLSSGADGGAGGGYSTAAQPGDPGNVRLWWY